jgi:hypothetical protein
MPEDEVELEVGTGKDLDHVVVHNKDGSEEVFDKGMVCQWDETKGTMVMKFIHMSGQEAIKMLQDIIYGAAIMLKDNPDIEIDPEE